MPQFDERDTLNIKKAFVPLNAQEKLKTERYDLARKINDARENKPGLMKGKGGY